MSKTRMLEDYLEAIRDNFKSADRYAAHSNSHAVLKDMAKDLDILREVLRKNITNPDVMSRVRHHPIIGLPIEENQEFSIIAHFWFPLPEGAEVTTHQSIHHHGNLLLSSVSPFGSGYESIVFKNDWSVDENSGEARLSADKIYRNQLHNLEFIDVRTPHVVFYPQELSVTYAMWSKNKKSASEAGRNNPLVKKFKKPLAKMIAALGLSDALGINKVEYFDFYIKGDKSYALKERVFGYKEGSHENFIQNILHILQQIEFSNSEAIDTMEKFIVSKNNAACIECVKRFKKNEAIADKFENIHINVDPRVNMPRDLVINHFKQS